MRVFPACEPLRGAIRPPGDKSISHRALLLAARASGTSVLRRLSVGDDVARTAAAVQALGALVEGNLGGEVRVTGGLERLSEPADVLDLGNSGTSLRLLAGYLSAFPWISVLTGDDSLRSRPMGRVAGPLREMGAQIDGRQGGELAPLSVRGGSLSAIDYQLPVPSAQVKGAILLAGLGAEGITRVHERVPTRMHTEELLQLAGGAVHVSPLRFKTVPDHVPNANGPQPQTIEIHPTELHGFELDVPADPSQAAFLIVAACVVPGSEVLCEGVYLGPGRAGFLDVLERMGARIERRYRDATCGDIVAAYGPLRGTEVAGAEVPGLIDEVPALVVAAALAEGTSTFRDVGELRVKESDRIVSMEAVVSQLGGRIESTRDSLTVIGCGERGLRGGGLVEPAGDHRVAMAAAVAALASEDPVEIDGFDCVGTSYPGFLEDLTTLGAL